MDADGQHDVCNIPVLYDILRTPGENGEYPDIVLGSRFMEGSSDFPVSICKRVAYSLFRLCIRAATKRRISDPTTGLQGLSSRAALYYSKFGNFDNKYPDANMLIQMLLLGYEVVEVPAVMHNRGFGVSMHSGLRPFVYMFRMMFSIMAVVFRIKVLHIGTGEKKDDIFF